MRRRRPALLVAPVAALAAVLTAAAPAAASSGPAPGSPAHLARDAQNIADAYGRQTAPDGQLNPAYGLANAQVMGPEYEAQLRAQAATPQLAVFHRAGPLKPVVPGLGVQSEYGFTVAPYFANPGLFDSQGVTSPTRAPDAYREERTGYRG